MSDEPQTKRAKVNGDESANEDQLEQLKKAVADSVENLDKVQIDLNRVNDAASAEIIKIEQKYNELRKPLFEKRQAFIDGIPNFWLTVFISHPFTRTLLNEEEEECFHYCTKFEIIEEYSENKNNSIFKFTFDVNPFFENTELIKKFTTPISGEADTHCTATKIDWKPEKKLIRDNQQDGSRSFFEWFLETDDPSGDDISDVIKDDIWLNPLQYYLMQGDDSSEDSDINGEFHSNEDVDDLNE